MLQFGCCKANIMVCLFGSAKDAEEVEKLVVEAKTQINYPPDQNRKVIPARWVSPSSA
jgi:hypothetical protein